MSLERKANFAEGNRIATRLDGDDESLLNTEDIEISVVSPLFNESQSLAELVQRITQVLSPRKFEIILVDDGSDDDSWAAIRTLVADDPLRINGLKHRRNFGKAEALATGFGAARGRYVVTIDADLQDDPAEIRSLIHI